MYIYVLTDVWPVMLSVLRIHVQLVLHVLGREGDRETEAHPNICMYLHARQQVSLWDGGDAPAEKKNFSSFLAQLRKGSS